MSGSGYVGRFAPSPTGRLHIGSMLAAVASWCDARHHGGRWLVRMEDLDPPREVPGAADDILRTLEGFGLHWDGAVRYQSSRETAYHRALEQLSASGWVFGCACTRNALEGHAVYPGHCRDGLEPGVAPRAVRFRFSEGAVAWDDVIQGPQRFDAAALGDFVVRRADGFWAYQLAVVADDLDQGVNAVIRGADLLDSTPRQCALWSALGAPDGVRRWGHLPVIVNAEGQKLSKQTLAAPVDVRDAPALIFEVLTALGQAPARRWGARPEDGVTALLNEAARAWDIGAIPKGPIHWPVA